MSHGTVKNLVSMLLRKLHQGDRTRLALHLSRLGCGPVHRAQSAQHRPHSTDRRPLTLRGSAVGGRARPVGPAGQTIGRLSRQRR
nr:hypothetical protein [Janibacter alkaliphilus]